MDRWSGDQRTNRPGGRVPRNQRSAMAKWPTSKPWRVWWIRKLGMVRERSGAGRGITANIIPDQFAGFVSFGYSATQTHALLWQNARMQDLGTLGGPDSDALLINERRQIAGLSITTIDPATQQPTVDPFLWENGKMIDLGTLGGVSR